MLKKNVLDRVYLETPCSSDWVSMEGNERVRYCSECNRQVHNLSAITKREAEELLTNADGKLCGRFDRDDRGNMITADRSGQHSSCVRLPRFARTAIAAFLGVGVIGQANVFSDSNGVIADRLTPSGMSAERTHTRGAKASLAGSVLDITGAAIAGATVSLTNETSSQEQKVVTSAEGLYGLEGLEPGTYSIKTESPGFVSFRHAGVELRANEQRRMNLTLQVGTVGGLAVLRDDESGPILKVLSSPIRAIKRALGMFS